MGDKNKKETVEEQKKRLDKEYDWLNGPSQTEERDELQKEEDKQAAPKPKPKEKESLYKQGEKSKQAAKDYLKKRQESLKYQ